MILHDAELSLRTQISSACTGADRSLRLNLLETDGLSHRRTSAVQIGLASACLLVSPFGLTFLNLKLITDLLCGSAFS